MVEENHLKKVKCKGCKTYVEKDDAIYSNLSNFCSWDCVFNSSSKKPKKKPKNVASVEPVGLPSEVREHVLRADGYKCRLCGNPSSNICFHHVIYKSEKKNKPWQDQTSNGITLCNQPCHLDIVHKNKKRFQPLCLGIIWLREVHGDKYTTIYDLEKQLGENK